MWCSIEDIQFPFMTNLVIGFLKFQPCLQIGMLKREADTTLSKSITRML